MRPGGRESTITERFEFIFTRDATRQDILSAISNAIPGFNPNDYLVEAFHPRMFNFQLGSPFPNSPAFQLFESTDIDSVLQEFKGLGDTPEGFVLPINIYPTRKRHTRYSSVVGSLFGEGGTVQDRLQNLVKKVVERREILKDLERRSGRRSRAREKRI